MTDPDVLNAAGAAAIKAAAILAAAGIVTASWRTASAATRHLIWTVAMCAAVAVPLIGIGIARLGGPTIGFQAWTVTPPAEVTHVAAGPEQNVPTASEPVALSGRSESDPAVTVRVDVVAPAGPISVDGRVSAIQSTEVRSGTAAPLIKRATEDWRRSALYLWIIGAVLALLPVVIAVMRVRLIASSAAPVNGDRWLRLIAGTPGISHLAGRVRVMESHATAMPMTWGVFSPVLLVPSAAAGWSDWKCRNILLHELAHVERRDCLTQLVAQVACALYWFNPLVWLGAHRMRVERELACDDRVIAAGAAASDYASNLIEVARSLRAPSFTSQTAIAMARPSQLSGRLVAVLDASRNRRSVTRRVAAGVSFTAVAVAFTLASVTPASAVAASSDSAAPSFVSQADISSPPAGKTASDQAAAFPLTPIAIVRASHLPSVGLVPAAATASMAILDAQRAAAALPPLAAITEPSVQDRVCWAEGDGNTSISISDDDKPGRRPSWSVRYTRNDCSLELRAEGKFTLRPDLSDIETLASDGWFRIEERVGRSSRRMEIRRAGNGALEHLYYVDGDRAEYDANARAWLARTLLAVERRTAFAASARVPQLYRSGGLRAVTSEIALMPSAYAKSKYYGAFLDLGTTLDANTLNGIVRQVSTDLASSDYYMADVLGKFGKVGSANESTWRVFAEAAGRMKSDYYKAETLKKVLTAGRLSNETVGVLLRSASGMKSDYYLTTLLKSVASRYALSEGTRQYYIDALGKIESDYYRGELLKAINTEGEWDARTSAFVLTSVGDIKSDYYKSQSLVSLVRAKHVMDWPAYFAAVRGIESGYYRKEALAAALDHQPLTREIVTGVLGAAATMKSDSETAAVLANVARSYRIDESLRPAFERAVDSIDSDYYRGQALSALRRSMTR